MVKLSIVLPTYNVEKYIARAIQSCLHQSYNDIEIIIVDDCGKDKSIEIAKKMQLLDERIKIIHNEENLGTYSARRIGVEQSTGDYIIFLDPDDFLDLNACEIIDETIRINSNPDLLFVGVRILPKLKPWQKRHHVVPKIRCGKRNYPNKMELQRIKEIDCGNPGKVVKKIILLDAYRLLDIDINKRLVYGEDALLIAAVIACSSKFEVIEKKLYIYYKNKNSITMQFDNDKIKYNISQLEYLINKLDSLELPDDLNRRIIDKIIKKLKVDLLYFMGLMDYGFFQLFLIHLKIIILNKSPRDVFRVFYLFNRLLFDKCK
ncbi:glycosyltransferase family 2 protein [Pectobacterium cacticida]|uniref:glycosyltransferase family 2 protein n=1 Tax=Pectobacterium cacticida TaxID=69221 RepID=UPI003985FE8A